MGALVFFLVSKMKVLSILFAIFSISSALPKEPESCQICRDNVGLMFKDWGSPETAKQEAEYLIKKACPQTPDADMCEINLLTWWEHVAAIIFPEDLMRNWDCDACKTNVEAMQEIFLAPTTAVRVTEYLKGEAFCQDPSLAFTEEESKVCQEGVTMFMPIALNVLFSDDAFESGRVCNFYLGVCKNGSPFASWM